MKLRSFLVFAAVVALVYAIGLLLMPDFMFSTYGMGTNPGQVLMGRYFGSALLTLGLIFWLARDVTGASARPIVTAGLIGNAVGLVVALMGTMGGLMSAVGWSAVAIYLVLTLGYAYFQFMAPAK